MDFKAFKKIGKGLVGLLEQSDSEISSTVQLLGLEPLILCILRKRLNLRAALHSLHKFNLMLKLTKGRLESVRIFCQTAGGMLKV